MVNITVVDLLSLATSIPYANQLASIANASTDHVSFLSYDKAFVDEVVGTSPTQQLVTEESWAAFHEAGIYNIATGKLYATSNRDSLTNSINVTVIDIHNNIAISSVHYPNLTLANGGAAFYPVGSPPTSSDGQAIVFCDQGDLENPSQLVLVDPANNTSKVLLNSFFGRNFTSINDIEQHPYTGDLWFTDPSYGFWQSFRPSAAIRPQVYRFEPDTGVVQAVADGFVAPNGIEFSPDYKHVYVTDTGAVTYPSGMNLSGPANIYRFDITPDRKRLENRQLFAYAMNGLPDGIHTDTRGNVYSGTGNGINVWNPEGVLIGNFAVAGGIANFAFVPGGIYMFNEKKLFFVSIKAQGRTVRRDFGLY
ncbi:hypothetical protein AMS68_000519 [Peltaster fructicola]|uniref:SMP-30/Gluconolactonase/LRE-like region domain-containing protein n=1 Tax=Peltaster fructicola TaxID=286661 RepID=A0A6H0XJW1_9PEZI|nr:hypothetical protein AMS68_000519 [Peltaster fructicola]